jgi:hypothetical protein
MAKGNKKPAEWTAERAAILEQFEADHPPMVAQPHEKPGIGVSVVFDLDETLFKQNFLALGRALGKDDHGNWAIREGKQCCEVLDKAKRDEYILSEAAVMATIFPHNNYSIVSPPGLNLERQASAVMQHAKINLRNEPEAMQVFDIARSLGISLNVATFNDMVPPVAFAIHHAMGAEKGRQVAIYSDLASHSNGQHKNRALEEIMFAEGIAKQDRIIFADDNSKNIGHARRTGFKRSVHADTGNTTPQHLKEVLLHMLEATQELIKEHKNTLANSKDKDDKNIIKDANSFLEVLGKEIGKIQGIGDPALAIGSVNKERLLTKFSDRLKNSLQSASQARQATLLKGPAFRPVPIPKDSEIIKLITDDRINRPLDDMARDRRITVDTAVHAPQVPEGKAPAGAESDMDHRLRRVANSFKTNQKALALSETDLILEGIMEKYKETRADALYRMLVIGGGDSVLDQNPIPVAPLQRARGGTLLPGQMQGRSAQAGTGSPPPAPASSASIDNPAPDAERQMQGRSAQAAPGNPPPIPAKRGALTDKPAADAQEQMQGRSAQAAPGKPPPIPAKRGALTDKPAADAQEQMQGRSAQAAPGKPPPIPAKRGALTDKPTADAPGQVQGGGARPKEGNRNIPPVEEGNATSSEKAAAQAHGAGTSTAGTHKPLPPIPPPKTDPGVQRVPAPGQVPRTAKHQVPDAGNKLADDLQMFARPVVESLRKQQPATPGVQQNRVKEQAKKFEAARPEVAPKTAPKPRR